MTKRQRAKLFETIHATALAVGVGVASHGCIDRHRIIFATRRAMHAAVARLSPQPDYLLIDALPLPDLSIPQHPFPKADAESLSVAAASVIAKVTRDQLMVQLDERYPGYGFARHKGYGTQAHQTALNTLGPCAIHRFSFGPIQVYSAPPLSTSQTDQEFDRF
jgi:ribonuclease HII